MMWNLQSYPTTVLDERMWHFTGDKTYWPCTYFQGVVTPQPPGSPPLHRRDSQVTDKTARWNKWMLRWWQKGTSEEIRQDTQQLNVSWHHLMVRVRPSTACDVGQDADSVSVGSDSCRIMHQDVTCQWVSVGKQRQLLCSVAWRHTLACTTWHNYKSSSLPVHNGSISQLMYEKVVAV